MNIELKKETLITDKPILEKKSEVSVESDIIVSDLMPDIDKILYAGGNAVIESRDISGNNITISGKADFYVIYMPKDSDIPVRRIVSSANFNDVFSADNIPESDVFIFADADISELNANLINDRKITIKATVGIYVNAYTQNYDDIICSIDGDVPIETKTKTVDTYTVVSDCETRITVPDKIEIPSSNDAIAEILKMDAVVAGQDIKTVSGKIIVKGTVNLGTLYLSVSPDNPIQFMEHELPFTEIIDMPGISEDSDCELNYSVHSIYYETDDDAESSVVGVETTIDIHAKAIKMHSSIVPEDCYSTLCNIALSRRQCDIEYIAGMSKNRTSIRGNAMLPEDAPKISRLYHVCAKPYVTDVTNDNGNITITGFLSADILYASDTDNIPLCGSKVKIPFELIGDIKAPCPETTIECDICLVNCSYNLSGDNSVDIRANVDVMLKLICKKQETLIENAVISEQDDAPHASVVICFVKPGETLWDIAKKYHTSPDKIIKQNDIDESSPLTPGTAIMIY